MSAPCRWCWCWWACFIPFWGYLLFDDLWHSSWLNGHNDVLPMFLSLNAALGPCLLLAVRQPGKHRLMIAYGREKGRRTQKIAEPPVQDPAQAFHLDLGLGRCGLLRCLRLLLGWRR